MFMNMRNKKKQRESPKVAGGGLKTDQQQQPAARRGVPEPLKLPSPLKYYPGTQMPMDGWFHACRFCRCWTAFSAIAHTGEVVPLCRRCIPSASRRGLTPAKAPIMRDIPSLSASKSSHATVTTAAAAKALAVKAPLRVPAAAAPAPKAAVKPCQGTSAPQQTRDVMSTHGSCQHHKYYHHQQQQQQQPVHTQHQMVQQQQYSSVGSGSSMDAAKISRSANIAGGPAAAAATAGMPAPTGSHTYEQTSSVAAAATEPVYTTCYKHLGPSNMHTTSADHYITFSSSSSNGSSGPSSHQSGSSDVLGTLSSMLSDFYKGFSLSGTSQQQQQQLENLGKAVPAAPSQVASSHINALPI